MTGFHLGIDIGATSVHAATARFAPNGDPVVTTLALGEGGDHLPACAFLSEAGEIVVGQEALRRGLADPRRLVRQPVAALGAGAPLLVAGVTVRAEALVAALVALAVRLATEQEGAPAASTTVTHPAAWGPHRVAALRTALAAGGMENAAAIPEPVAAALDHDAVRSLGVNRPVLVYDLGGTSLRCAVVRRALHGNVELLMAAPALSDCAGAAFDDAVLRHVLAAAPALVSALPHLSSTDLHQVRAACVIAKEKLSSLPHTAVEIRAGHLDASVRLTRSEFEALVEPHIERTVEVALGLLDRLDVDADSIILVGGSSRIPRVAQRLSDALDRPLDLLQEPSDATARGAARAGLQAVQRPLGAAGSAAATVEMSRATAAVARPRRRWVTLASLGAIAVTAGVVVFNTFAADLAPGRIGALSAQSAATADSSAGFLDLSAQSAALPWWVTPLPPDSVAQTSVVPPGASPSAPTMRPSATPSGSPSLQPSTATTTSPGLPPGTAPQPSNGTYSPPPSSSAPHSSSPIPPTSAPPTSGPPTSAPPATSEPPTSAPPATSEPPTSEPPSSPPPPSDPPATSEPPPADPPPAEPPVPSDPPLVPLGPLG